MRTVRETERQAEKDLYTADTCSLLITEPCDCPQGVLWSSLCLRVCSPVCVGVVMPSACLGALSIQGLEVASVSALGLHCV